MTKVFELKCLQRNATYIRCKFLKIKITASIQKRILIFSFTPCTIDTLCLPIFHTHNVVCLFIGRNNQLMKRCFKKLMNPADFKHLPPTNTLQSNKTTGNVTFYLWGRQDTWKMARKLQDIIEQLCFLLCWLEKPYKDTSRRLWMLININLFQISCRSFQRRT